MRSLKFYQSLLSLFFLFALAQAQVNIGGQPKSFKNSSLLSKIEAQGQSILLPSLDNALEQARADSIAKKNCTNCENSDASIIHMPFHYHANDAICFHEITQRPTLKSWKNHLKV